MAINLRRPTEAIIADGSITKEKLADGAVDSSKIEDGAIDLTSSKVIGELPNSKLAVISDIEKIQDNLITLSKVQDDVALVPLVGGEVEQSVTGILESGIVETGFSKTSQFSSKKARIVASLKSNNALYTASLLIYVNDEITPRLTKTSVSTDYELVNGEFDISDLVNGKHKFTAKLKSSDASGIAFNDFIEFYLVK